MKNLKKKKYLYIVHCIDTEGPLHESLKETFKRLFNTFGIKLSPTKKNLQLIQNQEINLKGKEVAVQKCFAPNMLSYNNSWNKIEKMLNNIQSKKFRTSLKDDFNGGWIYSWHCVDHLGFYSNPRKKDKGYGKVFNFYKKTLLKTKINKDDEINWHFHPLSLKQGALHAATSYSNNMNYINYILCRRIIDEKWFPTVNRPGFHSERSDSNLFLEQWIPFDYANQKTNEKTDQPDLNSGRFGDWSRAPKSWRGYRPSIHDYQRPGECNRYIFRCLNLGTRFRNLKETHINEAFREAKKNGKAILAFANHDYRDMSEELTNLKEKIFRIKSKFKDVKIKYLGGHDAAVNLLGYNNHKKPKLKISIKKNVLIVTLIQGKLFGSQPFLAIESKKNRYFHDNFDLIKIGKQWRYIFDEQTLPLNQIKKIGVGSAGKYGYYDVQVINL